MFSDLLPELQEKVLHYCNSSDLKHLSMCSSNCRDLCGKRLWRRLKITSGQLAEVDLKKDGRTDCFLFTEVLTLYDVGVRLDNSGVYSNLIHLCDLLVVQDNSSPLFKLTELHLFRCHMLNPLIRFISQCTFLIELRLVHCKAISSATINCLSKLNNLQKLDLRKSHAEIVLPAISTHTSLSEVHIVDRLDLTDSALSHLPCLVNLTKLSVRLSEQMTNAGLKSISDIATLEDLCLDGLKRINDLGFSYLIDLGKLEKLSLSYIVRLTDEGIRHIVKIRTLKLLCLSGLYIGNLSLSCMPMLPELEKLNITDCQGVSCVGLNHLSRIPSLKEVAIHQCPKIADWNNYLKRRLERQGTCTYDLDNHVTEKYKSKLVDGDNIIEVV